MEKREKQTTTPPTAKCGCGHRSQPQQRQDATPTSPSTPIGAICFGEGDVAYNVGRRVQTIRVRNTGDRPIQVGSHFHFFEVNRLLDFDRESAYGCHLNIPATTAIRFEPGEEKSVEVVPYGGKERVIGFGGLVGGFAGHNNTYTPTFTKALRRLRRRGYLHTKQDKSTQQ